MFADPNVVAIYASDTFALVVRRTERRNGGWRKTKKWGNSISIHLAIIFMAGVMVVPVPVPVQCSSEPQ